MPILVSLPQRMWIDEHADVPRRTRLSRNMSIEQFDNGYWYATELKAFADKLGVPRAGQLRKNELEAVVKQDRQGQRGPRSPPACRHARRRARPGTRSAGRRLHERQGDEGLPGA